MYCGLEVLGSVWSFHHLIQRPKLMKSKVCEATHWSSIMYELQILQADIFIGVKGSATFDKEDTTEEVCVSHPWEGDRGELNGGR